MSTILIIFVSLIKTKLCYMKTCICCNKEKPLEEFYEHSKMTDGHVNKCKTCCKSQSDERFKRLMKEDPNFREKEKERKRVKNKIVITRKTGNQIYLEHKERYPEKYIVRNMLKHFPKKSTHHLHHWSYNLEHFDSTIELSVADHGKAHRFIIYDQERYMYRRIDNFELLDTKELHEEYIRNCIKNKL